MNLRTKFILLIVGVTILPPLLIAFTFLLPVRLSGGREMPGEVIFFQRAIQRILPGYIETGNSAGFDELDAMGISVQLMEDGIPIYQNGLNDPLPELYRRGNMDLTADRNHISLVYPYTREGKAGTLLLQLEVPRSEGSSFFKFGIALFPVAILIVASIISLLIIRSVNRSIKTLESATREISSGNLDFELTAHGNDAFSSLTRSFNEMRRQLKEELARRSRFIMGVSHDLKTPLSLIEGYTDAILDGHADSGEKLENYLGIIKEKSAVLEQRISQLIEFVNMETGEWKFQLKPVNLKDFFSSLTDIYRDESAIMGYEFHHDVDIPGELTVEMDRDLVQRVFDNLLQNAVRYSLEPEKNVGLTAKPVYGAIVVSVSSRSRGIDEEEQKLIFEPFYRGSQSRNEKGFGLGLSSVKSVVEAHNWKIGVESELRGETVFSIFIPV